MRILISNDDGILAPGLRAMAIALATEHEVTVVAPDRERSATGHALTLHKPLRVDEVEIGGKVRAAYAVSGTPSDCIKLATCTLLPELPDMIFSGINRGPNLGSDVLYSGTVSAAREGALLGISAVAMSLANFSDQGYEQAAEFAVMLARLLKTYALPPKVLLNVNYPDVKDGSYEGIRVTRLGERRYSDVFEPRIDPRGKTYYWLAGDVLEIDDDPDTDTHAIRNRCVSITPIHYDMTHRATISEIEKWDIPSLFADRPIARKEAM